MTAAVLVVAMALEWRFGWPDALLQRIGHPVTWIGALINRLDTALNDPASAPQTRRRRGAVAASLVVAATVIPALILWRLLPEGPLGILLGGVLAAPFLATRSLADHVLAVGQPLVAGDIEAARQAVAMIVGRDPETLDQAGIARAAIESLAENASDGVTAPLFWGLLLGLPGLAGYKAINTLDSMIGHRTERHEDFGRFAARLDDLVNLIPARLTGGLFALCGPAARHAFAVMRRDAHRHRSPNAGWPESAMAASLGIRLSGPRSYASGPSDDPWLNGTAPDPGAEDVVRAVRLYRRAMLAVSGLLLLCALMVALG